MVEYRIKLVMEKTLSKTFENQNLTNENNFESGIPESFNVFVKEMRALGLNIELN